MNDCSESPQRATIRSTGPDAGSKRMFAPVVRERNVPSANGVRYAGTSCEQAVAKMRKGVRTAANELARCMRAIRYLQPIRSRGWWATPQPSGDFFRDDTLLSARGATTEDHAMASKMIAERTKAISTLDSALVTHAAAPDGDRVGVAPRALVDEAHEVLLVLARRFLVARLQRRPRSGEELRPRRFYRCDRNSRMIRLSSSACHRHRPTLAEDRERRHYESTYRGWQWCWSSRPAPFKGFQPRKLSQDASRSRAASVM